LYIFIDWITILFDVGESMATKMKHLRRIKMKHLILLINSDEIMATISQYFIDASVFHLANIRWYMLQMSHHKI